MMKGLGRAESERIGRVSDRLPHGPGALRQTRLPSADSESVYRCGTMVTSKARIAEGALFTD